jgi:hypothetical protein
MKTVIAAFVRPAKRRGVWLASLACTVLLGACLGVPARALEDEAPISDEPVVPPGQDQLLATMLGRGASLPDGCKFAGGVADGPTIRATYSCPSGEVVYELAHPSAAAEAPVQTDRFAVVLESGAPPEALSDVLSSLIRSREEGFEWKAPPDETGAGPSDQGAVEP